MKYLPLLICVLFYFPLTAQNPTTKAETAPAVEKWLAYQVDNFKFDYPADWELDTSGNYGTKFILYSPQNGPTDVFKENINLLEEKFPTIEVNHEDYIKLSLENMKGMVKGYKLVSSEKKRANGLDYQHVVYHGEGQDGTYDLRFEQYFWVFKHRAAVITFSSELNGKQPYLETGSKILNSLSISKFADETAHQPDSNAWLSFDRKEYSLEYPATWELDTSGQYGTHLMLFSPAESLTDIFRENANVMSETFPVGGITLDQYVTAAVGQVKNIIADFELVSSDTKKAGSTDYQRIVYYGTQGPLKLRFEQYCWVTKEKAFIITFTTERKTFEKYQENGTRILNSFKLK